MSLSLRKIDSADELQPLLPAWRALAATPLQGPEWLLGWWKAYQSPNAKLCVLVANNDSANNDSAENSMDEVVGILPLFSRENLITGRSFHFLGSGRACTDFQTILAHPAHSSEVIERIVNWFAQDGDPGWSTLQLEGVQAGNDAIESLRDRLRRASCTLHTSQLENTWRLDLNGGFDGFMKNLSKGRRRTNKNLINRFDRKDELTFDIITSPESVERELPSCIALHQKRWIAAGELGCFADPRFETFVCSAIISLAEQSKASINVLRLDGRAVACQLLLNDHDGNHFVYSSGRDPAHDGDRFGHILNLVAIRTACERNDRSIDYLRGDESYKGRLRAVPTPCESIRIVSPKRLPQLRHTAYTLGLSLRNQAKLLVRGLKQTPTAPAEAETANSSE